MLDGRLVAHGIQRRKVIRRRRLRKMLYLNQLRLVKRAHNPAFFCMLCFGKPTWKEAEMDRQRIGKSHCVEDYTKQLHKAIGKFLPWRGLPLISEDRRVRWTDRLLVMMAVLVSWQSAATMLDAFESARATLVRMYTSRRRPGTTLSGYLDALQVASDHLLEVVCRHLRACVRSVAGATWRSGRWVVMAVDGSRIDCPRTAANEEAFGCAGRAKTGPQQYLTTIFHVAGGLIWDYRRGPGTDSERHQLRQMLDGLPDRTLLLMDAGYSGYELLRAVQQAGLEFIVRVGANVRLLKKLGYAIREHDGIVYLWPQQHRNDEPLVLRRVRVRSKRQVVVLLTSVLEEKVLSDTQVAAWYRRRWMVETSYRTLKQTLGKRKMLSDAPHKAQTELDWAVVGLWLLGLAAGEAQPATTKARWSAALALRAVRRAMRDWSRRPPSGGLPQALRKARQDSYHRVGPKIIRRWPHKKNEPPCGTPSIRMATREEIRKAQRLWNLKAAG